MVSMRVNHLIEILNTIALENLEYGLWHVQYGEDWFKEVKDIAKGLNNLYEQRDAGHELSIDFNFRAAQVLKKMILHYMERNYSLFSKETMHTIIHILLTIDDRIESDLYSNIVQSSPICRTGKKPPL